MMDDLVFNIFFWGIFVGGGMGFVIFCAIMGIKQYKRDVAHQRIRNENQNGIPEGPEYDAVTVNAMVVDQACRVKTIGIKTPKTLKEFIITFKTENGEILKLNAPEEMYDGFDKNQTGILTLVDGRLYGFELTDNADSTI